MEGRLGGGEGGTFGVMGVRMGALAFEELGKLEADARTRELLTEVIEEA